MVGQPGLQVFQGTGDGELAAERVDDDGVPDRFDVDDVGQVHADLFGAGFHQHRVVGMAAHRIDGPFEFLAEREPRHRFEQVGQRLHLVSADGVLRRRGDEDDDDAVVALAYAPCGLHAVHLLHLDVEQQDVIDGCVVFDERRAVVECGDDELFALLALVPVEIIEDELTGGGVVLDHTDSDRTHAASPPSPFNPSNSIHVAGDAGG